MLASASSRQCNVDLNRLSLAIDEKLKLCIVEMSIRAMIEKPQDVAKILRRVAVNSDQTITLLKGGTASRTIGVNFGDLKCFGVR